MKFNNPIEHPLLEAKLKSVVSFFLPGSQDWRRRVGKGGFVDSDVNSDSNQASIASDLCQLDKVLLIFH